MPEAFETVHKLMAEQRVLVIVEVILERVANIAVGAEIEAIVEFEELVTDSF